MTRLRTIALCVLCALAVGLIAAATASAAAPEFGRCIKKAKAEGSGYSDSKCNEATGSAARYEWVAGPGSKPRFSAVERFVGTANYRRCLMAREDEEAGDLEGAKKIYEQFGLSKAICEPILAEAEGKEPVVIETTTGVRVECGAVSTTGEYAGAKTVGDVATVFTECAVSESSTTCQSAGAASGEVLTHTLNGELGVIKTEGVPKNNKIGLDLKATTGEVIAEFECGALTQITVTGSFIRQVRANVMFLEEDERVTQNKGFQKPEKFEAEPIDVLEMSFNHETPIQSGLGLLTRLTNEEKIEINSVV